MSDQPSARDPLLDLPFDQYSRHRIAQRVAESVRRAHGGGVLDVLDVGGFPCLTPRFLPEDRIVVVDPTPPPLGPEDSTIDARYSYVRADGAALPFGYRTFDLVVSLDSLEHVPRDRREDYVSELLRVSRGYVLIVAPFDQEETVIAEQLLAEFICVVNQEEQPQLREHRVFGLPRLADWQAFLRDRGLPYICFSSGFVHNWLPMMLVKHYVLSLPGADALHRAIDRLYNTALQSSDARGPGYRQGLLISTAGPSVVLKEMSAELAPTEEPDRLEVIERMERIGLLLKLADLHVASRRDDRLREQLIAKDRHILNLEAALREAEHQRGLVQERADALQGQIEGVRAVVDAIRRGHVVRALAAFSRLRGR